jgi:hypothetical protein
MSAAGTLPTTVKPRASALHLGLGFHLRVGVEGPLRTLKVRELRYSVRSESVGRLSEVARQVARAPAQPILRYFDRRFQDVHGHLDNETDAVDARLEEAVASMRALQERVATDVEIVSELTLALERVVERLDDRLDALVAVLERLVGVRGEDAPAEIVDLLDRVRGLKPGP